MPAPARIGLFRVLDDLVGALTRERWAVERPTPRVVDTITTRDSRTKRRQLKEPLQRLIELIPKGTAVLTKSTDPREILQDAQTAVREMLEAVVAGGIYQRGDGFPSGDYVGLCLRPFNGSGKISITVTQQDGELKILESVHARLPDALVAAVLALLAETGLAALGRCQYSNGSPCGRVFVKKGPQKWCREHQRIVRAQQLKDAFATFKRKGAKKGKAR